MLHDQLHQKHKKYVESLKLGQEVIFGHLHGTQPVQVVIVEAITRTGHLQLSNGVYCDAAGNAWHRQHKPHHIIGLPDKMAATEVYYRLMLKQFDMWALGQSVAEVESAMSLVRHVALQHQHECLGCGTQFDCHELRCQAVWTSVCADCLK